jgi:lysophospholipase L1-like esterase
MPRVFIDGSSTAYGLWGGQEGGWGERVKRAHMPDEPSPDGKRPLWKVYNLASPHRTINEIVSQLPEFIENYRRDDNTLIAVVMVGQIESRYTGDSLQPDMPIEKFENSLRNLAAVALQQSVKLVLVGTTPVVEDKVKSVGHLACHYDMEQRTAYDSTISSISSEVDAPYVHIMTPLLNEQKTGNIVMDVDGLHPNSNGHALIYDLVHPVIIQMSATK